MNTKLLITVCTALSLLPLAGYAGNLACPSAQEVMAKADQNGNVSMITDFGTLTGQLNPSVFKSSPYQFTEAGIPVEKVVGQAVYCYYYSPQAYFIPVFLTAITTAVYSPAVGSWTPSGSYATCLSKNNNPGECQFVQK